MERSTGTSGELPTFEAELDVPVSRPAGSGPPRRGPGGARSAGIAVAALVLLTAGVALGGVLSEPSPTDRPARPGIPTTSPTACVAPATDSAPSFALGVAGREHAYSGQTGSADRPGKASAGPGWEVPGEWRPSALASGSVFELRTSGDTCIHWVMAEYADAGLDREPRASERHQLIDAAVEPASQRPGLGMLPDGDWVLRAVATFEAGGSGSAGPLIAEVYFRLQVGPGPFGSPTPIPTSGPKPTPAVTPAVACGPAPATAEAVEIAVSAPGQAAVLGGPAGTDPPTASVGVGDRLEIAVVGDACATSWDIQLLLDENVAVTQRRDNPLEDPDFAAQNRWTIQVFAEESRLVAELHFGGLRVVREWRVVGIPFLVPEAALVGPDGSRVLALPGCGLVLALASGYSAGDDCGSMGFPAGLVTLHVPAWSVVTFEIPGWSISSWYGSCGRIDVDGGGNETFSQLNGCYLGGYSVTGDASPPAPARFLARPGEQVVQLYVSATRDGDTFQVPMFAVVTGE